MQNIHQLRAFVNEDESGLDDLDLTSRGASESIFPYVPIQLWVLHFERIVDRFIPKLKKDAQTDGVERGGGAMNPRYARLTKALRVVETRMAKNLTDWKQE